MKMATADWFTGHVSASFLFPIIYQTCSDEHKVEIKTFESHFFIPILLFEQNILFFCIKILLTTFTLLLLFNSIIIIIIIYCCYCYYYY